MLTDFLKYALDTYLYSPLDTTNTTVSSISTTRSDDSYSLRANAVVSSIMHHLS